MPNGPRSDPSGKDTAPAGANPGDRGQVDGSEAGPEAGSEDGPEAGPEDGPEAGPAGGKDPLRFSSWMKRSATGAVMTGIAVGLREALEAERPEVPFVIEAPSDPHDPDAPIELRFDPDSPAGTVAVIRRAAGTEGPDSSRPAR